MSSQAFVQEYYGRMLASSADLKTTACCAAGAPPAWLQARLDRVHDEVQRRFYGCGFPIPHALDGARVLDLGCGTGRDVFVLAQLVGPGGRVLGVDMTAEQLAVAESTAAWHAERFGFATPNTSFHLGYIEDLSFCADASLDVVVSNCVINLSPRKDLVLAEAMRVLKPGGELYFSDVLADRRLPAALAEDPVLHAECLGGAMYEGDFLTLARRSGFLDPRVVSRAPIQLTDPAIARRVGAARFSSVTLRLFKLDDLDAACEDYGQLAVYRGGIEGAEHVFWLDDHHAFEVGRPERICRNTAAMLSRTRLGRWFEVIGAADVHYGAFPCGGTMASDAYGAVAGAAASCC